MVDENPARSKPPRFWRLHTTKIDHGRFPDNVEPLAAGAPAIIGSWCAEAALLNLGIDSALGTQHPRMRLREEGAPEPTTIAETVEIQAA